MQLVTVWCSDRDWIHIQIDIHLITDKIKICSYSQCGVAKEGVTECK